MKVYPSSLTMLYVPLSYRSRLYILTVCSWVVVLQLSPFRQQRSVRVPTTRHECTILTLHLIYSHLRVRLYFAQIYY